MNEKEKEVLTKLSESIPKLSPTQKEYISGLADGMALAQAMAVENRSSAENTAKQ